MNIRRTHHLLATSVLTAGTVFSLMEPVHAQDTVVQSDTAGEATVLKPITVTARRREEKIQDAPVAVTAIPLEDIAKGKVTTLEDAAFRSPNVLFNGQGGPLSIRGVTSLGISGGVDRQPAVGLFLDDVFLARPLGYPLFPEDLERLEIVRGSQATLYGKNTIGGAVNLISREPGDTASGEVSATIGSGLAYANALQIGGMMAGFMVGGGGTLLMADHFGQAGTFLVLALLPVLTIFIALAWQEPARRKAADFGDQARLISTFKRPGIWTLLVLAFIYGGAHAGGLSISKIFLVDLGWSNSATGTVSTFSGFVMLIVGCPLGSYLTMGNRWRAMSMGMLLAAAAFLFWGLIAGGLFAASWLTVLLAIALLSIASGVIAVSAATILMAFGGAGKQAGTDITVLQSANVLGEMVIAGLVVWVVGQSGYAMTFAGAALAVFIAAFAVLRASRRIPLAA